MRLKYRNISVTIDQQGTMMFDAMKAKEFLEKVYPDINFENAVIRFSGKVKRCVYRTRTKEAIICNQISSDGKYRWYTYRRTSIGRVANGILITPSISRQTCIVHELTHWVQHIEGRKYSETETTLNEIRFMEKYYPSKADKLEIIKRKKRRPRKKPSPMQQLGIIIR